MTTYVGFWLRLWANFVDSLLLALVTLVPQLMFGEGAVTEAEAAREMMLSYGLSALIVLTFWFTSSATPGKMLIRARIADARTGEKPTARQFLIRYAAFLLALLPMGLGLLWILWDERSQGWHDKIAGTVVLAPKRKMVGITEEAG